MGLASGRSLEQSQTNVETGHLVVDTIVMKESYGITHAPGIVVVLGGFPHPDPQRFVGRMVTIRIVDGRQRFALIEGARDHGETISFFFKGLTIVDVPIGSVITLEP